MQNGKVKWFNYTPSGSTRQVVKLLIFQKKGKFHKKNVTALINK